MKRLLFSGCEAIILLMVAISFLVTDRLRYVMIVSIPDTINHQELERNLFIKKTYGEVLNLKLKAIIARERLQPRILFANEFLRTLSWPENGPSPSGDSNCSACNSKFSGTELPKYSSIIEANDFCVSFHPSSRTLTPPRTKIGCSVFERSLPVHPASSM